MRSLGWAKTVHQIALGPREHAFQQDRKRDSMRRSVNLLVCLGVLVVGIVLAQANDSKDTETTTKKPCCGDEKVKADGKPPAAKAAADEKSPPYACLQYLLYEDGDIALWSADEYAACAAEDVPEEVYLWTSAALFGPQTCPGCEDLGPGKNKVRKFEANPKLTKLLDKKERYNDRIPKNPVTLPGYPTKKWNYNDGIAELGEMQFDYVAVNKKGGGLIPIKLSAGVAEFDKVRFAAVPPPPKVRRRTIAVNIGLEVTGFTEEEIKKLPLLPTYEWKYYSKNRFAFTVKWEGNNGADTIYYVTTEAEIELPEDKTKEQSKK